MSNLIKDPTEKNDAFGYTDTLKKYKDSLFATNLGVFILSAINLFLIFALTPGIGVPADSEQYAKYIEQADKLHAYSQMVEVLFILALGAMYIRFIRKQWGNHKQYFIQSISIHSLVFFVLTVIMILMTINIY
jgi:hypothetical protein